MLKTLYSKLLVLMILSSLLPAIAIGAYGLLASTQALSALNLSRVTNETKDRVREIESFLGGVRKDLRFLVATPPFQGVVRARAGNGIDRETPGLTSTTYADWLKRANTIMSALMLTDSAYQSIRYLDETGQEISRIEVDQGKPHVIPPQQLVNQKQAIYFEASLKLRPDEFYVSPINLDSNIDPTLNDGVGDSRFVIYYTTAIFDASKQIKGIVVVTLRLTALNRFLNSANSRAVSYDLIDHNGQILLGSQPKNQNQNSEQSSLGQQPISLTIQSQLKNRYSQLPLKTILDHSEGTVSLDDNQLLTYQKIAANTSHEMVLLQSFSEQEVMKPVYLFELVSIFIAVGSLGLVLLIGLPILRRIAQDQTNLYEKAQEATEIATVKVDELAQALNTLQQTQQQLIQTEKMSGLGQLVAGVAHEINNPVNFIHGNINYIREYSMNLLGLVVLYQKTFPQNNSVIEENIEEIDLEFIKADLPRLVKSMEVGTSRIREIVLSLRNFSRVDEADHKIVNLHEGIDSTLMILSYRLKARGNQPAIQLVKKYDDLPLIECYPGMLNQVFMNLLVNAIQAIEAAHAQALDSQKEIIPGQLMIETQCLGTDWVQVKITDTGIGIPEGLQDKILQPFFTTKPVGQGTGLGLSISYQIVTEKHQGRLSFSSSAGQGTEFVLQLPVKLS